MELQPPFFSFPTPIRRSRELLRPVWEQLAQLRQLQELLAHSRHLSGLDFVELLLRHLQIVVRYDAAELRRLPAAAFVAVVKQPCGLLDGLVLVHVLGQARPQLRAVANQLLAPLLPQLAQLIVPATPRPRCLTTDRSLPKMRQMLQCLHNDVPLLLLPATERVHNSRWYETTPDSTWGPTIGRLLAQARVPVVPLWFCRQSGPAFRILGLLQPLLGPARLPAELLSRRGQTIQVRIGQPVTPAELGRVPMTEQLSYLKARIRALGTVHEQHLAALLPPLALPPVLAETSAEHLEADIAALRPSRCLVHHGRWEVLLGKTVELPHVLREIGRLRELTLRHKGEGTQHPTDLDSYDSHYHHLFLYDRESRQLVGACRLGLGRSVLRRHGRRGFYLHSLFRLKKALVPVLRQSVELSRLFVRAEYQHQPVALALLWKGIAEYLVTHPEYQYVLSPVSISSQPLVSKATMVDYLQRHSFNAELAAHVRPRKQFAYRPLDTNIALAPHQASLNDALQLQKLMGELELGGSGVPVLLKPCLKQNAQLLAFSTDPRCSSTLSGLLLLDVRTLPTRAHRLLNDYGLPA